MGKRGRPRKTNQVKIVHMEEEMVGSPAEKVVATLKRLGFGPGDLDLGKEVIEVMMGSPIESLRKDSPEKETPRREAAKPPSEIGKTRGVSEIEPQLVESGGGEIAREVREERQEEEQGETLIGKGDSNGGNGTKALWSDKVEGENKGRKAWAEVVKGPQSLHPDQKLRYIPP